MHAIRIPDRGEEIIFSVYDNAGTANQRVDVGEQLTLPQKAAITKIVRLEAC